MKFVDVTGTLLAVMLLASCGEKPESRESSWHNTFKVYDCSGPKAKEREQACELTGYYTIKVRRHKESVYIVDRFPNGDIYENFFLESCKIFDTENWKCNDLMMAEGKLLERWEQSWKIPFEHSTWSKYERCEDCRF